ncbi:putative P-loop containing nucleoside triphosphate hydrolase, leucine-rich repeat domain superfamily [Helianthus debilis subsp. tardiflorus]
MADAATSALVKIIFEKLSDEVFKEYARAQGIQSELDNLGRELSLIQALLHDASEKEVTEKSVGLWLNSLQHLAYDIEEDVLDDVATEAMRLGDPNRGNETSLLESDVVGRVAEKDELLKKLLGDDGSSKESFSIVPIVGMGGVGKTTLARILYNDTQVKDHFQLKAWVCVSDDFDVFKISKTIFQDVSKENKEFENLNQLQVALTEQLKDKRFLLVLDDVWTENYDHWEKLVRPLNSGAPGSRVIMTTRKKGLLERLGFGHLDLLESLSSEDALSLFALHALGVDTFDPYPNLREKGEAIVKKCGTLPLALKAIGRLLRTKTTPEKWDDVLSSQIWNSKYVGDLPQDWKLIFPALMLSYHDLSANLKRLFAYCSLFPKDFLFNKEELVLLWIGEGFLNQSNATKSQEDFGKEDFETLLSRSFFQHAPNDESLYVMHDLMNDLATFIAKDCFLKFENHTNPGKEALTKYRHMSFVGEEYETYQKFEPFKRARSLRTLLAVSMDQYEIRDTPSLIQFPLGIGELKSLQTLTKIVIGGDGGFAITELKGLNNLGGELSIEGLCKVQSAVDAHEAKLFLKRLTKLELNWGFGSQYGTHEKEVLKELKPNSKWLKELSIDSYPGTKFPEWVGDPSFSQLVHVSMRNCKNCKSLPPLGQLPSLKELYMSSMPNVKFIGSELTGTNKLTVAVFPSLEILRFLDMQGWEVWSTNNKVFDAVFPCLRELQIVDCPQLIEILRFKNMGRWKGWPTNREVSVLPCLRKLDIVNCPKMIEFSPEALPSLEYLWFKDMLGWKMWSTNDAVFPCLRELHINNCPELIDVLVEALPFLRVLAIAGCGDGVLRSLVRAASSIINLDIGFISGLTYEVWRDVIQHIGAIEELRILGCSEIRYLWESEEEASKVLVNIKKLVVSRCSNLVSLGEKEEKDNFGSNLLSSLRILEVRDCDNMERCCCPNNIESLDIRRCSSLTHVSFPPAATGGWQKLKSLKIEGCEKLMEKISSESMPMLESINISEWTNLKSIMQLGNFIYLTKLYLKNCPSLESFPDIPLPVLTSLTIEECNSMESLSALQMKNLSSLKELIIRNCRGIDASCHGGVWPPNLYSLEIGGLKKPMSEWGPQNFPSSCVDLTLYDEPDVRNFRQLSHIFPSSLTRLWIHNFEKLESLSTGLQHLTSLQHLNIEICPKMKHLPKHLLPSLLSLTIYKSPYLRKRCEGRGSHYYPLISHIPCIRIYPV